MRIGILGTGRVALLLAPAWQKAGHTVVLGSRDPSSKRLDFPVQSLVETVRGADIIVNALPGVVAVATLSTIPTEAFAGKTVIDVANAFTSTADLVYPNSSVAEHLQAALPTARIVKTLNTGAMAMLSNPTSIGASSVFLSGESAKAKVEVAGLLRDLGWSDDDIVDLGGIETARGPEHYFVLFATLADALNSAAFNIRVVR